MKFLTFKSAILILLTLGISNNRKVKVKNNHKLDLGATIGALGKGIKNDINNAVKNALSTANSLNNQRTNVSSNNLSNSNVESKNLSNFNDSNAVDTKKSQSSYAIVQAGTNTDGKKIYCFEHTSQILIKLQIKAAEGKRFVCVDENDALGILKGDQTIANKVNSQRGSNVDKEGNINSGQANSLHNNGLPQVFNSATDQINGTKGTGNIASLTNRNISNSKPIEMSGTISPNSTARTLYSKQIATEVLKILATKIKEDPEISKNLNDPKRKHIIKKVLKLVYSTSKLVSETNLDQARESERDAALEVILNDPSKADLYANNLRVVRNNRLRKLKKRKI